MKQRTRKMILSIFIVLLFLVIFIGTYVTYVCVQYYRIEDDLDLTNNLKNNQTELISLNQDYSIVTYNIGFGAYSRDFSFFLDTGYSKEGIYQKGKRSTAKSKEEVLKNISGSIDIVNNLNVDFMFFQEVYVNSTRSYKVNQLSMIESKFVNYSSVFGSNAHSAYLFYPLHDPHGIMDAGIATFSKYKTNSVTRKQLPITNHIISRLFDLDRCFMVSRLPIKASEKELVLINIHMSAYDEGGVFRKQHMDLIQEYLKNEYDKGNYVILGGDFNHDIAGTINKFPTKQEIPEWVSSLSENDLTEGYYIAASADTPTCRSCEIPYEKDVNYFVTIDGFIVSNNIELIYIENINELNNQDVAFMYSDHTPVYFKFKLL